MKQIVVGGRATIVNDSTAHGLYRGTEVLVKEAKIGGFCVVCGVEETNPENGIVVHWNDIQSVKPRVLCRVEGGILQDFYATIDMDYVLVDLDDQAEDPDLVYNPRSPDRIVGADEFHLIFDDEIAEQLNLLDW